MKLLLDRGARRLQAHEVSISEFEHDRAAAFLVIPGNSEAGASASGTVET